MVCSGVCRHNRVAPIYMYVVQLGIILYEEVELWNIHNSHHRLIEIELNKIMTELILIIRTSLLLYFF